MQVKYMLIVEDLFVVGFAQGRWFIFSLCDFHTEKSPFEV